VYRFIIVCLCLAQITFDDYQIHTVAAVFKKFLRALPEPLVPHDKYFEFLQASSKLWSPKWFAK